VPDPEGSHPVQPRPECALPPNFIGDFGSRKATLSTDEALTDAIRQDAARCWSNYLIVPTLHRYSRAVDPRHRPCAALEAATQVLATCRPERHEVRHALAERYPNWSAPLFAAADMLADEHDRAPYLPEQVGEPLDHGKLRYSIGSRIASGSNGQVFVGTDRAISCGDADHDARLIVKLLQPASNGSSSWQQEAETASTVGAPCGVRVVDSGVAPDGNGYIVMERVDGLTLIALAASEQMSPPRHAGVELAHLADALETLHARALGHGDIHPANVMLDRVGHLRLVDYGNGSSASAADDVRSLCALGLWMTLGYLPPPGTTVPWQWSPMRAAIIEAAIDALNNPRTAAEFSQGLRERMRRARIRRNTLTTLLMGLLLAALMYLGGPGHPRGPRAIDGAGTASHQADP